VGATLLFRFGAVSLRAHQPGSGRDIKAALAQLLVPAAGWRRRTDRYLYRVLFRDSLAHDALCGFDNAVLSSPISRPDSSSERILELRRLRVASGCNFGSKRLITCRHGSVGTGTATRTSPPFGGSTSNGFCTSSGAAASPVFLRFECSGLAANHECIPHGR